MTFQGYLRSSGQAGVRNYLGVLSTVALSNRVAAKPDPDRRRLSPRATGARRSATGSGFAATRLPPQSGRSIGALP